MTSVVNVIKMAELDKKFCDEVMSKAGGEHIRRCFACGTCVAGCPISEIEPDYSPRRLVRQIMFGMREQVLASPVIWYCLRCYRCTEHCPQDVNFCDVMRVLRHMAVKEGHVPPRMLDKVDDLDRDVYTERRDKVKELYLQQADAKKEE